jgi:threonine dehydratase
MTVTLEAVHQAAHAIRDHIPATPCHHSLTLSRITGAQVFLKFENLNFTGSFKERGALVRLLGLNDEARRRGVIAMSAGNHAQGVAYHAQRLGISTVIVMPRYTPNVKVEHTREYGAEVLLHGANFDEAAEFAGKLAVERGLTLIHPFDDELVIAGQGTVALEMLSCTPELEMLVVPVGGGGLIAGNAIAGRGLKPDLEVIGIEAERFPAMHHRLQGLEPHCGGNTIAEGIAVRQPGRLTLPVVKALVSDMLLVEENVLEQAVLLLLEVEKTVVEGAGAAGLAALLQHPQRFAGRRVGLILSGGNIDLLVLSSIIQRGLVRSGRLVRLTVEARDAPGSLAEVTRCIAETDANIVEIHHQRTFSNLPVQSAEVELVLQTRGLAHMEKVLAALHTAGFNACHTRTGNHVARPGAEASHRA